LSGIIDGVEVWAIERYNIVNEVLSDEEADKSRIRTELRYITEYLAVQASSSARQEKTRLSDYIERMLGVISNGFVLLIAGSIITSCLVPHFQKETEKRTERALAIQDCFTQFLQYSLSRYEEMMAVSSLGRTSAIEGAEYDSYMQKLSEIRLKRYVAWIAGFGVAGIAGGTGIAI
jgi:hypothetical protein